MKYSAHNVSFPNIRSYYIKCSRLSQHPLLRGHRGQVYTFDKSVLFLILVIFALRPPSCFIFKPINAPANSILSGLAIGLFPCLRIFLLEIFNHSKEALVKCADLTPFSAGPRERRMHLILPNRTMYTLQSTLWQKRGDYEQDRIYETTGG